MPEVAVDKNCDALRWKYNVGLSRQIGRNAKAQTG
jgi:hypothetical protein